MRFIAFVFVLISALPLKAHDWYELSCCSGMDCASVPVTAVQIEKDGWFIVIEPGEHPMVLQRTSRRIPFGDRSVRQSQDSDFHACVSLNPAKEALDETGQHVICLYVPDMLG